MSLKAAILCQAGLRGTVRPCHNHDAVQDAAELKNALKGLSKNKKAIIEVFARRSFDQRIAVQRIYESHYNRKLTVDLKKELTGSFERATICLLMGQLEFDVYNLEKAMEGACSLKEVMAEIYTTRSKLHLNQLPAAFKKILGIDLQSVIDSLSDVRLRDLFNALADIKRPDSTVPIDETLAELDALRLLNAAEKRVGCDHDTIIQTFTSRSENQLALTLKKYTKLSPNNILSTLKREISGDLRNPIVGMAQWCIDKPMYFAQKIHQSIAGAGTQERDLIRLIVGRCEIDMVDIKAAYTSRYGKSMIEDIKQEAIASDIKKLICALLGDD